MNLEGFDYSVLLYSLREKERTRFFNLNIVYLSWVTQNKKALNLLDEMLSSRYVKFLPRSITSSNRLRALWEIITESMLKSSRVLKLLNSLMIYYQEVTDWICLPCTYDLSDSYLSLK